MIACQGESFTIETTSQGTLAALAFDRASPSTSRARLSCARSYWVGVTVTRKGS